MPKYYHISGEFDEPGKGFFKIDRTWEFSDVLIADNAIDAMRKIEIKLQQDYGTVKDSIIIKTMSLVEETDQFNKTIK